MALIARINNLAFVNHASTRWEWNQKEPRKHNFCFQSEQERGYFHCVSPCNLSLHKPPVHKGGKKWLQMWVFNHRENLYYVPGSPFTFLPRRYYFMVWCTGSTRIQVLSRHSVAKFISRGYAACKFSHNEITAGLVSSKGICVLSGARRGNDWPEIRINDRLNVAVTC